MVSGMRSSHTQPWRQLGMTPDQWLYQHAGEFVFAPSEIASSAQVYNPGDGPDCSGLYFLIDGKEISYVGISVDVSRRLETHYQSEKVFDSVWWVCEIPDIFLRHIENLYIITLKPRDNRKSEEVDRTLEDHYWYARMLAGMSPSRCRIPPAPPEPIEPACRDISFLNNP